MNPRVRTALGSVVAFVVAFAVVLLVRDQLGGDDDPADSYAVDEALLQPSQTDVVVHGYLFFEEEFGVLLCGERTATEPPRCEGAVFSVEGADPNRFDLVRPDDPDGEYDAWSRDEVTILGHKRGALLDVLEVLR